MALRKTDKVVLGVVGGSVTLWLVMAVTLASMPEHPQSTPRSVSPSTSYISPSPTITSDTPVTPYDEPNEPDPTPEETETEIEKEEAYYKNCTEARKDHPRGISRGEPGYRRALDRNRDGVACER